MHVSSPLFRLLLCQSSTPSLRYLGVDYIHSCAIAILLSNHLRFSYDQGTSRAFNGSLILCCTSQFGVEGLGVSLLVYCIFGDILLHVAFRVFPLMGYLSPGSNT